MNSRRSLREAAVAALVAPSVADAAAQTPATPVTAGWDTSGSSRQADSLKYYATFERTTFEGGLGPDRDPEDAIVFRAQLAF